jgi:hypothetical protein
MREQTEKGTGKVAANASASTIVAPTTGGFESGAVQIAAAAAAAASAPPYGYGGGGGGGGIRIEMAPTGGFKQEMGVVGATTQTQAQVQKAKDTAAV